MLPSTTKTGMPGLQEIHRAKVDQLQYTLPKATVQRAMETMGLEAQTDIWIYPNYPAGFTAVVGAEDVFVYIFECVWGKIVGVRRRDCLGVRPNGSLIYS